MSNILISMLCYIINILLFKFAGIIHTLIIVFLLKVKYKINYLLIISINCLKSSSLKYPQKLSKQISCLYSIK